VNLRSQERLEQLAEELPSVGRIAAGSLWVPFLEKSDKLTSVITERGLEPWYFFATAAVVYRALMLLREVAAPERFEYPAGIPFDKSRRRQPENRSGSDAYLRVAKVIEGWTDRWYRDGDRAVIDCGEFVDRGLRASKQYEEQSSSEIAAGLSVLWNVYGERPPRSDDALLGPLGFALFSVVTDYWNWQR